MTFRDHRCRTLCVAALIAVACTPATAEPAEPAVHPDHPDHADAPPWGGPARVRSQFSFDLPHLDLTPDRATLLPPGASTLDLQIVHSNTFEITPDYEDGVAAFEAGEEVPHWEFLADGEVTRVSVRFERAIGRRVQLGLEVPALVHSSGVLDSLIADVHEAIGVPQNARERRPEDELRHELLAGDERYLLEESGAALGDVVLRAKLGLVETRRAAFSVVIETSLPTGDEDALAGTSGAEHGLTVLLSAGTDRHAFHGGLGHFLLDPPDAWPLPVEDRTAGFAGYEWIASERWSLLAHVAAATSLLPEAPQRHHDELRVEVVVGARLRGVRRSGQPWSLDFGFVENVTTNDNTADLGLFLAGGWGWGR